MRQDASNPGTGSPPLTPPNPPSLCHRRSAVITTGMSLESSRPSSIPDWHSASQSASDPNARSNGEIGERECSRRWTLASMARTPDTWSAAAQFGRQRRRDAHDGK